MEIKVKMLLEELVGLKCCVKGKKVMDLGQALGSNSLGQVSDQRVMGSKGRE